MEQETQTLSIASTTSSTSSSGIVSRFRLQATFTLDANDFSPYGYIYEESQSCDRICIRASCCCSPPLKRRTKSTNLLEEILLKGGAEMYLPKLCFDGFLDVQEPDKQHYWNRRYCKLDGVFLYVWRDKSGFNISPLITIDLRNFKYENYPLICCPRELCARSRSFYLDWKPEEFQSRSPSAIFFSADTKNNLDNWLKNLNIVIDFIAKWIKQT